MFHNLKLQFAADVQKSNLQSCTGADVVSPGTVMSRSKDQSHGRRAEIRLSHAEKHAASGDLGGNWANTNNTGSVLVLLLSTRPWVDVVDGCMDNHGHLRRKWALAFCRFWPFQVGRRLGCCTGVLAWLTVGRLQFSLQAPAAVGC